LKLDQYSELSGSINGEWLTNFYTLRVKAHAEPIVSASQFPPGDVDLALRGDTNSVRVEKAMSTIPGLQLVVSDPIELSYRGKMLSERAEIQMDADLAKLPKLKLNGRVRGKILLEKGEQFPTATFRAGGTNLSGFRVDAESFEVAGKVDWPKVENFSSSVRFSSNSLAEVQGSADLKAWSLGETSIRAEGALLTNLLPASVQFNNLKLKATISGGLTNLEHAGEFELRDVVVPQLQPLTLEATWKAKQMTFDELAMRARAGPATIFVSGSGFAGGGRTNFVVRELKFLKVTKRTFRLQKPSRITLSTNAAGMELEVRPMALVGTNRQAFLSGGFSLPKMAAIDFRATNVNPSLFQTFVTRSLSGWTWSSSIFEPGGAMVRFWERSPAGFLQRLRILSDSQRPLICNCKRMASQFESCRSWIQKRRSVARWDLFLCRCIHWRKRDFAFHQWSQSISRLRPRQTRGSGGPCRS
jgi:hypothetical protein